MELSLPPGMDSQSFTARVNGASAWQSALFFASAKTGSWFTVAVPLDDNELRPGTNFVSILFENLQEQTGNDGTFVAAQIKSIRVRQP